MSMIEGKEKRVGKVLSSDYEFHIPDYQRPYAWTEEQAEELFQDLWTFHSDTGEDEKYFLGSIVLVKGETPKADVVDGQQRLTTLTILFAAIDDRLCNTEYEAAFSSYVMEPGNIAESLKPKPRLFLRQRDVDFFRKHVQEKGGLERLADLDAGKLRDSRANVCNNARYFQKMLAEQSVADVLGFGQFIVKNCYLVIVSTDNFNSAYRIFSVLNDRGLELEPSDILKARLIGKIASESQSEYTGRWEDLEQKLGRKGFNDLLTHVRMIFQKEKARRSVLEEFGAHVMVAFDDPRELIDNALVPYADAYDVITRQAFESTEGAGEINTLLGLLNRLNNFDWIPVAMEFVRRFDRDAELLSKHFWALERLAGTMFVRGVYVTPRIERFGRVLKAMEDGEDLLEPGSPLQLSDEEVNLTLRLLDGEVYTYSARLRMFILVRLDAFLAGTGASYDHRVTTIEHVLPQNPSPDSEWRELWGEEQRDQWANRLGNLVLLSRAKNAQASNFDFTEKKERYFKSRSGVSLYASSTQVLNHEEWTPAVVEQRQQEMLEVFRKGWHLQSMPAP